MSLLVGMNYAKMLSKTYKKPFLPIHHMEAHALTVRLINRVRINYRLCEIMLKYFRF